MDHSDYVQEAKIKGILDTEKTTRITDECKSIDNRARFSNLKRAIHAQRIEDDYYDNIIYVRKKLVQESRIIKLKKIIGLYRYQQYQGLFAE